MNVRVVGRFTSAHLLKLMQVLVLNNTGFYILGVSMINNVWKCLKTLPGAAEQMKALWVS